MAMMMGALLLLLLLSVDGRPMVLVEVGKGAADGAGGRVSRSWRGGDGETPRVLGSTARGRARWMWVWVARVLMWMLLLLLLLCQRSGQRDTRVGAPAVGGRGLQ